MTFSENCVQSIVSGATSHLQQAINQNLVSQRREAKKHDKNLAEARNRAEFYGQCLDDLLYLAERGARKLIRFYRTSEIQEMLSLLQKSRGQGYRFEFYDADADFGGEYMNWYSTRSVVIMSTTELTLELHHMGSSMVAGEQSFCNKSSNLNDPTEIIDDGDGEIEVDKSLKVELVDFLGLLRQHDNPEWVVENTLAIDIHSIPKYLNFEDGQKYYLSWLAFLVACNKGRNTVKFLDAAVQKMKSRS